MAQNRLLGLKRVCMFCSTKFYDLGKTPIICPKCGEAFDPNALFKRKMKVKDHSDELTMDSLGLGDDIEIEDDDNSEDVLLENVEDESPGDDVNKSIPVDIEEREE